MTSVKFTIGDVVLNALAFNGTSLFFSRLVGHGNKKGKIYYEILEKFQWVKDKWN